jgi:hypothetical protein
MFSLRNILMGLAVLSAIPLSLAAPSPDNTDVSSLTPDTIASFDADLDARDVLAILNARDESLGENSDLEVEDVVAILEGRATSCGTTSKKGSDCAHATCPDSECKVSDKGRCVWTHKKNVRPYGCDACKCYKIGS